VVRFAINTGRYRAAEDAFRSVPAATLQERAHAEALAGQLAEAIDKLDEAIAHYHAAIALNPRADAHFDLARAKLLVLDMDGAREHMRLSLESNRSVHLLRNQPIRVSQTHIGQLVDEFTIDMPLFTRLIEICRSESDQILPLFRLVVDHPDYTGAAIRLVLALRRGGYLRDLAAVRVRSSASLSEIEWRGIGSSRPLQGTVPRRLAQYWDASLPPPDVAQIMRSWVDLNPDYAYQLFDDANARKFLRAHCEPAVFAAYVRSRHAAQRADIFRLAWLLEEGGVWADADDRCIEPLRAWLPDDASLLCYQEDYGTLGNDILAATPGHPVIALALIQASEATNRGDSDIVWLSTGPGLVTRAFAQVAASLENGPALLQNTVLVDRGRMKRSVALHCPAAYKKSDRHWSRAEFLRKSR
jgi:hypothetical protein